MATTRIETFTDAAFAFASTLLVLLSLHAWRLGNRSVVMPLYGRRVDRLRRRIGAVRGGDR